MALPHVVLVGRRRIQSSDQLITSYRLSLPAVFSSRSNSFTALLLKQPAAMATYELSSTLARYLDKHLCFPLLEFLQDKGVYNEEDIMRAKIALLQGTNMVDFAMDIHKELYQSEDVPAAMTDRRTEVVNRLRSLQKAVDPIINCLSNPNVIRNFRYVVAS
jgi:hypothetical protein